MIENEALVTSFIESIHEIAASAKAVDSNIVYLQWYKNQPKISFHEFFQGLYDVIILNFVKFEQCRTCTSNKTTGVILIN